MNERRSDYFYSPGEIRSVAWILFGLGTLGSVILVFTSGAGRFWPIFLVNLLFWSGISLGGVMFSAIIEMTNTRWGRPFKRIAESASAFLPISFVLFVILIIFGSDTLGWNTGEIERIWLSQPFLAVRDIFGLLILYSVTLYYVYVSLRPDIGTLVSEGVISKGPAERFLLAGWEGTASEVTRKQAVVRVFAPIVIVLFCVIQTVIGIDFIMALDPEWFSTLFGGYFFMGNIYMGLAFLISAAVCLMDRVPALQIRTHHLHDLGKLLFGICIIGGDFFWSQFLVIWYGNLPEETSFVILRSKESPWAPLGWTVLIVAFLLPFVAMISRKLKTTRTGLLALSWVVLIGMWLEKFLLVVPSLSSSTDIPFGLTEISVTAAFAGIFIIVYTAALRFFPVVPVTDPIYIESISEDH